MDGGGGSGVREENEEVSGTDERSQDMTRVGFREFWGTGAQIVKVGASCIRWEGVTG